MKAAGVFGIHRTARAVGVDYYALKKRVEGSIHAEVVEAWVQREAEAGRLFVRNVCMVFDRYLGATQAAATYSRTL